MYAVIQTGGKQYKVSEGEVIRIEKIDGEVGGAVEFDRVLMLRDGDKTEFGAPVIDKCVVSGEIVAQELADKIEVVKFHRRKGYMRRQGHRQQITAVKITGTKEG